MTAAKHAHRVVHEDGTVTCECGKQFKSDADWAANHSDWQPDPEPKPEPEPKRKRAK